MNKFLQQTFHRLLAGMLMLLPVIASAQQHSISGTVMYKAFRLLVPVWWLKVQHRER